jgi:4-amino-4-deoxy-L-arabinose transferase-like glycosyltransferase
MSVATKERLLPVAGSRIRPAEVFRHWEHLGLAGILALAAVLNFLWLGREGYGNSYYAAAIKSMLQSWHNFFFVSFDPGGFVTVDKPPLGFWIQTASAKIFGFHGWSILAPQALAGVVAVLVLFLIVRRTFGPVAGLVAAAAMTVTPVAVADNRNNTIDSLLVLTLLFAAWAVLKACENGRPRWLLLGMALVGVGFNIKMLEAYLILPALVALYAIAAPHRWHVRVLHLAVACGVLAVVSLSWAVTVDLTPANQRPYVGSSQHNSEIELAFGYNGVQRLLGMGGPPAGAARRQATSSAPAETARQPLGGPETNGAIPGDSIAPADSPTAAGFRPPQGGPGFVQGLAGPLRLFDEQLGGQASWLLPVGLAGAIAVLAGAFMRRRQPLGWRLLGARPDPAAQQVILWGVWVLAVGGFFSVAGFFHPYYLIMLAPAAAALAGIGVVALSSIAQHPGRRRWLLPVALLATAGTQIYLLAPYPSWNRWLSPLIAGLAGVATVTIIVTLIRPAGRFSRAVLSTAMLVAVIGMLIAPGIWSGITTAHGDGGGMPAGGPAGSGGFARPPGMAATRGEGGPPPGFGNPGAGGPPAGAPGGTGGGDASQAQLINYLQANRGGARFLLAVPSSMSASSIIIQTGEPVMALGGFSGGDPILTEQQVAQDVTDNTVRFFLLSGQSTRDGSGAMSAEAPELPDRQGAALPSANDPFQPPAGMPGPFGQNSAAESWVTAHCATVPSNEWRPQVATAQGRGGGFGPGGTQQLYDCASASAE